MAFDEMYIRSKDCGIDYGTDADIDGVPGAYTEVFAKDIEEDLGMESVEVEVQKPSYPPDPGSRPVFGPEPLIAGPERAGLKFKVPWRGGRVAAGTGGDSLLATLGQYGGFDLHELAGGAGDITGGSTTTMTCADVDADSWNVGDMIILDCNVAGGGSIVIRQIESITTLAGTTTVTVTPEMPDSPVAGENWYPTDTLVPKTGKVTTYTAFDVYRGGVDDYIRYRLLGGALSALRLAEVQSGGLPWAELEYMFGGGWTHAVSNRAHAEDTYGSPLLFLSDRFYIDDTAVHLASIAFDCGLKCQSLPGQTATGIQGFHYLVPEPELTIKPLFDDQFLDDYVALTERKVFYGRLTDEYEAWAIGVPSVQFAKAGAREDYVDGVAGAGVTCRINDPGVNASGSQLPLFAIGFSGV